MSDQPIDVGKAYELLKVPTTASENEVNEAFNRERHALETKIAQAPTPGLQDKYRQHVTKLAEAKQVIDQSLSAQDLPVVRPDFAAAAKPAAPVATIEAKPAAPAAKMPAAVKWSLVGAVVALVVLIAFSDRLLIKFRAATRNAETTRRAEQAQRDARDARQEWAGLAAEDKIRVPESLAIAGACFKSGEDALRRFDDAGALAQFAQAKESFKSAVESGKRDLARRDSAIKARDEAREEQRIWSEGMRIAGKKDDAVVQAGEKQLRQSDEALAKFDMDLAASSYAAARDLFKKSADSQGSDFRDLALKAQAGAGSTLARMQKLAADLDAKVKKAQDDAARNPAAAPTTADATLAKLWLRRITNSAAMVENRRKLADAEAALTDNRTVKALIYFSEAENAFRAKQKEMQALIPEVPLWENVLQLDDSLSLDGNRLCLALQNLVELKAKYGENDPDLLGFVGMLQKLHAPWQPAWAMFSGTDQYGRWAVLCLKTSSQRFRTCPAGNFSMGSPAKEAGRDQDETLHPVKLSAAFWIADGETTQQMWQEITNENPSQAKDPNLPVSNVSWDDCQAFIAKLNGVAPELKARLPSEAEWEYACRAGSQAAFAEGGKIDELAWFVRNSSGQCRRVKLKQPNAWGIHDMHGNCWEWCADSYGVYPAEVAVDPLATGGSRRIYRGGSWSSEAIKCRSAIRNSGTATDHSGVLGFRLGCSGDRAVTIIG